MAEILAGGKKLRPREEQAPLAKLADKSPEEIRGEAVKAALQGKGDVVEERGILEAFKLKKAGDRKLAEAPLKPKGPIDPVKHFEIKEYTVEELKVQPLVIALREIEEARKQGKTEPEINKLQAALDAKLKGSGNEVRRQVFERVFPKEIAKLRKEAEGLKGDKKDSLLSIITAMEENKKKMLPPPEPKKPQLDASGRAPAEDRFAGIRADRKLRHVEEVVEKHGGQMGRVVEEKPKQEEEEAAPPSSAP